MAATRELCRSRASGAAWRLWMYINIFFSFLFSYLPFIFLLSVIFFFVKCECVMVVMVKRIIAIWGLVNRGMF